MTVAFLMLFGFVFVMDLLLVIAVYVVLRFERRRKLKKVVAQWKPVSEEEKEKSNDGEVEFNKAKCKEPGQGDYSSRPGSKPGNNRRKSSKCSGSK